MKRIVLGAAILAVLLCLAILFTVMMDRIHSPLAESLLGAARAAAAEDWDTAKKLADRAASDWERSKHFTAALADHSPMDDIDGLFGELKVYLEAREMPQFAATCRHLAKLAQAMGDNHALRWWNLL